MQLPSLGLPVATLLTAVDAAKHALHSGRRTHARRNIIPSARGHSVLCLAEVDYSANPELAPVLERLLLPLASSINNSYDDTVPE